MSHNALLTVRATTLAGFAALCQRHGADARALLHQAGLPKDTEDERERRLPVNRVNALLERAAMTTRRADFGLQLAQLRGFSNLGPVGLLARDEPTIAAVIATIADYISIHNDALEVAQEDLGACMAIRTAVLCHAPHTQASDLAVAMLFRILRELAGSDWQPEQVCLSRARPADDRAFGQFFGVRPQFGAGFDAVVVDKALLARPNRLADPAFHRLRAEAAPHGTGQAITGMVTRVRRILPILIANQRCTADHVASQLGVSRRTLTRQLTAEGVSFLATLDGVRDTIARAQLATSGRKLADISDTLGFSSPAAFSGWFRRRYGVAPRDWRRLAGNAGTTT